MTKAEIIHKIARNKIHLQEQFNIAKIGLFGSYAKETQKPDSDIDLVYETKNNTSIELTKLHDLENFFEVLFKFSKVDLVHKDYINPTGEIDIEKTVIYI